MARRRKKKSSLDDNAVFQSLVSNFIATNQNLLRISKLGNLSRPGGLTQYNAAAAQASDASNELFNFVSLHPEFVQLYRDALNSIRF